MNSTSSASSLRTWADQSSLMWYSCGRKIWDRPPICLEGLCPVEHVVGINADEILWAEHYEPSPLLDQLSGSWEGIDLWMKSNGWRVSILLFDENLSNVFWISIKTFRSKKLWDSGILWEYISTMDIMMKPKTADCPASVVKWQRVGLRIERSQVRNLLVPSGFSLRQGN